MRVWTLVKCSLFVYVQRGFSEWSLLEHKLIREHEWYTVFVAIGCEIERSLLNVTWSWQVCETNLIAHHVPHGGVSAGVRLLSQIYVLIMFENLWRKSFTAGTKPGTVCTDIFMFGKFTEYFVLVSIAHCASLLFVLQRELAGLVAHPLLKIQGLKGHGGKWKHIAAAHSINLVNIFNRTDHSLTWSLSYARSIRSLLPWRQTIRIESILARTAVGAQIQRLLFKLGCSNWSLTIGSVLLILSLEWT